MTRAYIRADVPDELLQKWLQHLRDFDAANPGCHFDICADGPDIPMRDMVETLRLNPALKFSYFFERANPLRVCIMTDAVCNRDCVDRCALIEGAKPGDWE